MTKERRIAIGMWKYIRDQYSSQRVEDGEDLEDYVHNLKGEYMWEHGDPHWAFRCWFCQYIGRRDKPYRRYDLSRCCKCPLKSCSKGSAYMKLCNAETGKEWVEACDEIIQALGGTK